MPTVQPGAATVPSNPTDQRHSDPVAMERIERHVDQIMDTLAKPTATETFQVLVAEHGLVVEEWDTSTLDEKLRAKFGALYLETADRKTIVVPAGQDPAHRLAAVRAVLAHLAVTA